MPALTLSPFTAVVLRTTNDDHGVWTNAEGIATLKDCSGSKPELTDDGALVPAVTKPDNTTTHQPGAGFVLLTIDYSKAHGIVARVPVIRARDGCPGVVWTSMKVARVLRDLPGYRVRAEWTPEFKAARDEFEGANQFAAPAFC